MPTGIISMLKKFPHDERQKNPELGALKSAHPAPRLE
jgi:hypothetical protein